MQRKGCGTGEAVLNGFGVVWQFSDLTYGSHCCKVWAWYTRRQVRVPRRNPPGNDSIALKRARGHIRNQWRMPRNMHAFVR